MTLERSECGDSFRSIITAPIPLGYPRTEEYTSLLLTAPPSPTPKTHVSTSATSLLSLPRWLRRLFRLTQNSLLISEIPFIGVV